MKIKNNAWIKECIEAIENEIVVDSQLYKMFNASAADFANTPRPSKWLAKFSKENIFLKLFLKGLRFSWGAGLSTIFSLFEMKRFISLWEKTEKIEKKKYNEYGLGFSDRAYEVIPRALKRKVECWISFPWNEAKSIPANSQVIPFLSLLERKDFSEALVYSKLVYKELKKDKNLSSHIIQGYVAYRWLLVRIALSKLEGQNYCTAEHFDRWALLADRLVAEQNGAKLSLTQHGALGGLDSNEATKFPFIIPNKLKSVSHLYVFSKPSEQVFLEYVLQGAVPEVSSYSLSLDLQEIEGNKLKVLFVGHTICEDFHVQLFKKISEIGEISAYYKPHPLSQPSDKIKQLNWQIIHEKSYFPKVDILVSYPSTLVEEYGTFGIHAIVHSLNANVDEVDSIFSVFTKGIENFKISIDK